MNIIKRIYGRLTEKAWNIGFIELKDKNVVEVSKNEIHWLNHKLQKEGWFADPFIYDYNDREIVVLVEEFSYSLNRGIISKLVIDRHTYRLIDRHKILTLDTHLSFPAIIRYQSKDYIYPENLRSGSLKLYEFDNENNSVKYVQEIVPELVRDSIIWEKDGFYYLITTVDPDVLGREAVVYKSDNPFGDYKEYKRVLAPEKTLRNAGYVIEIDKKYYKLSQDCRSDYGAGLIVHELSDNFEMKPIKYLKIGEHIGIHTYNRCRDLAVVDSWFYVHPIVAKTIKTVVNIIKEK